MAAVRCVVFDLDDTLFLERDYVASGFRAVGEWAAARLGVQGFSDAAWSLFEGGVRGTTFDDALRRLGVEPAPRIVRQMVDVYRAHSPSISLLEDARASLDDLLADVRLAVISDGPIESQTAKARAIGIEGWTDLLVFTAALGPGCSKPAPRAFMSITDQTACSGPACVYVGDNPSKDFVAPASLGWRTVRVRRPGSLHERIPSGPDVEMELTDLWSLSTSIGLS